MPEVRAGLLGERPIALILRWTCLPCAKAGGSVSDSGFQYVAVFSSLKVFSTAGLDPGVGIILEDTTEVVENFKK